MIIFLLGCEEDWHQVNNVWCTHYLNISDQRRYQPSPISRLSSSPPTLRIIHQSEASMESPELDIHQLESRMSARKMGSISWHFITKTTARVEQSRSGIDTVIVGQAQQLRTRTISVMNWFTIINIRSVKHWGPSTHIIIQIFSLWPQKIFSHGKFRCIEVRWWLMF